MAKFSNARLPEDIEQDAQFSLIRQVEKTLAANGFSERSTAQAHHLRRATLRYGARQTAKIKQVKAAWAVCLGGVYAFRFKDWTDYKTSADASAVSATDQQIGVGDGTQAAFQLATVYTFDVHSYSHPIMAPKSGTVLVALDGVAQVEGTDFTVNYDTGMVTFTTPPALGAVVTGGCEFDVWMTFEDSEFTMEHLLYVENTAAMQVSQTAEITLVEVLET